MVKKEHEYAQVLRWIADGETVEWQASDGRWLRQEDGVTLLEIRNEVCSPGRYRRKPRTTTINGHEVPEPMRVAPERKSIYWFPDPSFEDVCWKTFWDDDEDDRRNLARGLCHSTREAAEAHARALLSFTTTEGA